MLEMHLNEKINWNNINPMTSHRPISCANQMKTDMYDLEQSRATQKPKIHKDSSESYLHSFSCRVDQDGIRLISLPCSRYIGYYLDSPLPPGTPVEFSIVPVKSYCDLITPAPDQNKNIDEFLNYIAELSCVMASREVIAAAVYHRTSVVVERDGKTKEVDPLSIIDNMLFKVLDKSER
ncbi:hypothetical protein ALT785_110211 [Alteromonas infernus]